MHAASVYPEPGSNSLNMIYQGYLGNHHTEFVCSTYFKELIFLNSKEFSESFTFCHCCSIFKELRAPSEVQLCYYIKTSFLCQYFFQVFSKFFLSCFKRFDLAPVVAFPLLLFGFCASALAVSLVIISTTCPIVNYFFHLFLRSTFYTTHPIHKDCFYATVTTE